MSFSITRYTYLYMTLFVLPAILLGLIIGSFLNVVLLRHGARAITGRSGCMSCGRQLKWYDMVPVLSWVFLRGKCRQCHSRISFQYPFVEASNAALFGFIAATPISFPLQLVSCVIASLLLIIAVYDVRHTIIPDSWVYLFAFFAFAFSFLVAFEQGQLDWMSLVFSGPLCALPFAILWFVSRGTWMGLGDAKLALGIGWLLGLEAGVYAIFLAFIIGALISVCVLLPLPYLLGVIRRHRLGERARSFTMKSEVAFGPFLISATLFVWFALMYQIPLPLLSV